VTEEDIAPLLKLSHGAFDGALSPDGRIAGCYVHGLFNRAEQRAAWLEKLGAKSDGAHQADRVDAALNEIASQLERVIDVERLGAIAGVKA